MKQIAKSEQIKEQLRAAFGVDANLDALAVYEAIALNSLPLRQGGGIFKGARNTLGLLGEMASWIRKESVPLQSVHNTSELPYGRVFHGSVVDDQLRVLFAVDGMNHADIVTKIDSGVLDQVSVGFLMKSLKCSQCAFDYMAPNSQFNLYTLECSDGHKIGEDGAFVWVDGLQYFFELSLVGMGAADGAKIVGKSDARLQAPEVQQRLAASAGDFAGVRLSPTIQEVSPTMNTEQMAAFQAAVSGQATAQAQLTAMTEARDVLQTQLTAANTRIEELQAAAGNADAVNTANAERDAAQADLAAAVTALQGEAKTVLTACGKPVPEQLPGTVAELTALIAEHRAQFAGVIPVGGAGAGADSTTKTPVATASAAFRAPR